MFVVLLQFLSSRHIFKHSLSSQVALHKLATRNAEHFSLVHFDEQSDERFLNACAVFNLRRTIFLLSPCTNDTLSSRFHDSRTVIYY